MSDYSPTRSIALTYAIEAFPLLDTNKEPAELLALAVVFQEFLENGNESEVITEMLLDAQNEREWEDLADLSPEERDAAFAAYQSTLLDDLEALAEEIEAAHGSLTDGYAWNGEVADAEGDADDANVSYPDEFDDSEDEHYEQASLIVDTIAAELTEELAELLPLVGDGYEVAVHSTLLVGTPEKIAALKAALNDTIDAFETIH